DAVARLRSLAESVGASFHTVVGDDVPAALLDFARGVNATQLVLGTSRRSRWERLFDEGIGSAVIRGSGPIDVHMVTHDEAARGVRIPWGHTALSRSRRLTGWALAVLAPAWLTLLGFGLRSH